MSADAKISAFEANVLGPALDEILAARRLAESYEVSVRGKAKTGSDVWSAWSKQQGGADPDALWDMVDGAVRMRRRNGPSLILVKRERRPEWPSHAGVFLMIPYYQVMGSAVYAAPGVGYWMKFNQNVHVFTHRYDNAIANHPIENVNASHVLNHVLNSVGFYEMHAFADRPFPGYRTR